MYPPTTCLTWRSDPLEISKALCPPRDWHSRKDALLPEAVTTAVSINSVANWEDAWHAMVRVFYLESIEVSSLVCIIMVVERIMVVAHHIPFHQGWGDAKVEPVLVLRSQLLTYPFTLAACVNTLNSTMELPIRIACVGARSEAALSPEAWSEV